MIPKKLIIVNKITKNANGKIDRKYLAKNYYDRKKLIKILKTLIKKKINYKKKKKLISNGHLDSFSILMLISKLESEFKIKIKLEKININNFNSIEQIKKSSKLMKIKEKNKLINNLFQNYGQLIEVLLGRVSLKVYALLKKRLNY